MNIINLILSNLKRYTKSYQLMLLMILMPIALVLGVTFFNKSSEESYTPSIAIVCDKNGEYEKDLILELNLDESNLFTYENKDNAIEMLKNNEFSSVFIFEKDFSHDINNKVKPYIKQYKTVDGGGSLFEESKIENYINDSLKNKIDPNISSSVITSNIVGKNSLIKGGNVTPLLMICYCLYLSTGYLSKDLLDLRSNNVLRRMLSTKNTNLEIMLSMSLSLFLIQAIISILVLLFSQFALDINLGINGILIIIANSFVSTGLTMFLARTFKTETGVTTFSTFYTLGCMLLSWPAISTSLSFEMPILNNIAKLTPLYWSINSMFTETPIINYIALILIGLVFITMGSFRLKDFANK